MLCISNTMIKQVYTDRERIHAGASATAGLEQSGASVPRPSCHAR